MDLRIASPPLIAPNRIHHRKGFLPHPGGILGSGHHKIPSLGLPLSLAAIGRVMRSCITLSRSVSRLSVIIPQRIILN